MRMGNLLIYSAADIFCIWPRALPRCRWRRGLRGRKLIRRGRCASLSHLRPVVLTTLLRASLVNGCRSASVSNSSSRTSGRWWQYRYRGGRAFAGRRWIQWQRRILIRWEYHAHNFLGFVQLAYLVILFKQF